MKKFFRGIGIMIAFVLVLQGTQKAFCMEAKAVEQFAMQIIAMFT